MARTSKSARQRPESSAGNGHGRDAAALLEEDHRRVEGLFRQFEGASEAERRQDLVREICRELIIHARLEEELFYPACREKDVQAEALDRAQVEHDLLNVLIGDLLGREPGSAFFDAKVAVLSESVKHHVEEEERPVSGILAKARQGGVDLHALGKRLQERRTQLVKAVQAGEVQAPDPRTLEDAPGDTNRNRQEMSMAREFDRDVDEERGFGPEDGRGRFGGRYTREQDDRTGGRQFGRGGYGGGYRGGYRDAYRGAGGGRYEAEYFESRDRYDRGRDYGGPGGHDDDRGGRAGYDGRRDDYYRGSASGGMSGGRFGRGHGSFEREDDDYRRGMGSRDRGRGWSGRDEDYRELGRHSRYGGGREYEPRRPDFEDDDFGYMTGGRSGGWRDRD